MIDGFLCVPFIRFVARKLTTAIGWEEASAYLGTLDVLLPASLLSAFAPVVVSLLDRHGRERLQGVKDDLRFAGGRDQKSPSD